MTATADAAIEVHGLLTSKEHYHAVRAHQGRMPLAWVGPVLFLGLPAVMVFLNMRVGRSFADSIMHNLFWVLFGPVFYFVAMPLIWRISLVMAHRANPRLLGDKIYRLHAAGFEILDAASTVTVGWPAVIRVVETELVYLVYVGGTMAHVVPLRPFRAAGVLEMSRALLRQHVVGKLSLRDTTSGAS